MHGNSRDQREDASNGDVIDQPRKANDCFTDTEHLGPPKLLFGEFWREGELGLLFGAAGTGKSVLAMQIADGISRGRGVGAFEMTAKRQRVLYVDLRLSERQFKLRYMSDIPRNGTYSHFKFAEQLYRQRPLPDEDLYKWLRKTVVDNKFRVVVIDDLSAVRNTCDGTRETMKLMRQLRRLQEELDISILVLAGCREPGRGGRVREADLQRSRVLCDAADGVFAIGRNPGKAEDRYIVQTRSASAVPVWNDVNAPICRITKIHGNFLGFTFDERFQPSYTLDQTAVIISVKLARLNKVPFRKIAETFGFSPSTAVRLAKQFRPSMMEKLPDIYPEDYPDQDDPDEPDDEEVGNDDPEPDDDEFDDRDDEMTPGPEPAYGYPTEPAILRPPPEPPPPETPREILLGLGMRETYDENEREIFVEKEDARGGRQVWYRFDAKDRGSPPDRLSRHQSNGVGSTGRPVDGPICLYNSS